MSNPGWRGRIRLAKSLGRVGRMLGADDALPIDPDLDPDDPSAPRATHVPAASVVHRRDPRVIRAIALGGFAGTLARYEVEKAFPAPLGGFPWATFAINTSGAFMLGLILAVVLERGRVSRYVRPIACVGFLGAWTTMSTLAIEADLLARGGHVGVSSAYLGATLFAGLAATALGLAIGRARGQKQ